MRVGSSESFTSQTIRPEQCLHVTKLRCGFRKFVAFKTTSHKDRAAQIGLDNYIIFMNETLTSSNELLHIATLRHNKDILFSHH